ncbi:MAG TPA: metal-sulfur cluster assembly factor [Burkholderiales bacterium]|nr:metal-sulfur cluster assembly factor [Burkholderiales bacterium]
MTLPTDDAVWDALRTVNDPEVGMNVVDLGLVYRVDVQGADVHVELTMTSPACPLGDVIVENAAGAIRAAAPAAGKIDIALVWDPPWTPDRMSEAARAKFGW